MAITTGQGPWQHRTAVKKNEKLASSNSLLAFGFAMINTLLSVLKNESGYGES